jgi:hypothetical protein
MSKFANDEDRRYQWSNKYIEKKHSDGDEVRRRSRRLWEKARNLERISRRQHKERLGDDTEVTSVAKKHRNDREANVEDTNKALKDVAYAMWGLYDEKLNSITGTEREMLEFNFRHAYKGAGENATARYWMIKMLFDEFQEEFGDHAVLHMSVEHTEEPFGIQLDKQNKKRSSRNPAYHPDPDDLTKRLKWTNKHLFTQKQGGFIFLNEEHVVNIRLDANNNVVIRETQREDIGDTFKNCLYESGIFDVYESGILRKRLISFDERTPQQTAGGCTVMAMFNARCSKDVYPTTEDINNLRLHFFLNIYDKLIASGETPMDIAGDEWMHFRLGLFSPHGTSEGTPWYAETSTEFCEEEELQRLEDEYITTVRCAESKRRIGLQLKPFPVFEGESVSKHGHTFTPEYSLHLKAYGHYKKEKDIIKDGVRDDIATWREKTKGLRYASSVNLEDWLKEHRDSQRETLVFNAFEDETDERHSHEDNWVEAYDDDERHSHEDNWVEAYDDDDALLYEEWLYNRT